MPSQTTPATGEPPSGSAFLSTTPATRREKALALVVLALSLAAFLAIVPFVRMPLARVPAIIA